MRKLKILDICPLPVYPLNYGGAIASFSKAFFLKEKGHEIDFVTVKDTHIDYLEFEKLFPYTVYIKKKNKLKALFSIYPYSFECFKPDKNEIDLIIKQIYERKYDIVIFEYPYSFFYYQKLHNILRNLHIKMVYFSHNIEFLYAYNTFLDTDNYFYKVFFYIQYLKLKKFEPIFLKKDFDLIFSVSYEETNLIKSYNQKTEIIWLPPIVNMENTVRNYEKNKDSFSVNLNKKYDYKILFVGSLNVKCNIRAIKWFIEMVMPILRRKINCCFIIVGRNPTKEVLNLVEENEDVFVFKNVKSLKPFYENSDLVIIPLFNNTGIKIKLIEALKYGKKVVARPEGVYGSGLQDVVPTAETPKDFADKCIQVLENKIDYTPMWQEFNEIYDKNKIINLLESKLLRLIER
jgi:hypothetical protein